MLLQYETGRLILKVLTPDAASSVLDFYLQDKELFERYEADRPSGFYTVSFQKNTLHAEYSLTMKLQSVRYYVFLKENPAVPIGTVCLYNIASSFARCEIGYKFSSAYHHHGYASEAVERCIDMAFAELGIHRICAMVQQDNTSSIRLLESLGFQKEGICRHYLHIKGNWVDHLQYSLLSPISTFPRS
ncbi:MAG: GNAT family N-acetyltransferase [Lachnospiraceae bacterium]|nr:GNAT family N-acetyltransferase [Lachnospiraceae bacterium]